MTYRIDYKQLAEHWKLDEWPDEIIVYHQLTPNIKHSYMPVRFCHVENVPMGICVDDGDVDVCSECRVPIDSDCYYCGNCGAKVIGE